MAQSVCVATLQEAQAVIAKFEIEHTVQFNNISATKNFGKITIDDDSNGNVKNDKVAIRLKDPQTAGNKIAYQFEDDCPFAILGKKLMGCVFGRDRKIHQKMKLRETKAILGLTQRRDIISKRKDCPAKLLIRHIVIFPGFKEAKTRSIEVFTRKLRKMLRDREPIRHEHRYYIHLPGEDEHANHPTGEAGLRYGMAAPIRARIQELARLGIHSPAAIKIHLRFMVENELFKGQTPPPKTNSMYWPSHKTIYSNVYRIKKGGGPTSNTHFRRNYDVVPHNLIRTQNSDLLHHIVDEVGLNETGDGTSISSPKRLKTKTTSTLCSRTYRSSLQHNETTILTSLSQMDGTKQPILPTIQVINPSHYLGGGQLFLDGLRPQEEVLNANTPNKANKAGHKRKGAGQDGEVQQQGQFFQLCQIQQGANGVKEEQTSLVFVPSEAMHEWSDSLEIETTPTTSQQICQPSIDTSWEAQGSSADQCVLVEVQESQYASQELESICQQLPSTDCSPLVTDSYTEEVSILSSPQDELDEEEDSQLPTVFTDHSTLLCSSAIAELGPELSTTNSLQHIVHDHDYGNSVDKGRVTDKPDLDLPTSCIEHLKELLETRDVQNIVSAFLNVPSLKSELLQQLVKKF